MSPTGDEPEPIKAIRLKHPGRIIFAIILVVALALFLIDAAQRPAYSWDNFAKYLFDKRISQAALNTLLLTVYSMAAAIVLGITLAVMRLSENPVVKSVAWLYLWIFRGTPVYVQLVFWGLISTIYATIDIGIPFTAPWMVFETKNVIDYFWLAVIGLSLNEAAYTARRRPRPRSGCHGCRPCAGSSSRRPCASSSRRPATRSSRCSRRLRS
jgi:polar amino acid transport system permease protein